MREDIRKIGMRGALLCLSLFLLGACAQPVPGRADCDKPAAGAVSVRLLLSFHQPVAGDAPQTLMQLRRYTQVCVHHVASVSPTVHAYVFTGAADATLLRQRLLGWPAVRDAVPDTRVRAH